MVDIFIAALDIVAYTLLPLEEPPATGRHTKGRRAGIHRVAVIASVQVYLLVEGLLGESQATIEPDQLRLARHVRS